MWFWKKKTIQNPVSSSLSVNGYDDSKRDYESAVGNFMIELQKYCSSVSGIKLYFEKDVNKKNGESIITVGSDIVDRGFFNFWGDKYGSSVMIDIKFLNNEIKLSIDEMYLRKKNHSLSELHIYDILTTALLLNLNKIYPTFYNTLKYLPPPDSYNSHLFCHVAKTREGMYYEKTFLFCLYLRLMIKDLMTKMIENKKNSPNDPISYFFYTNTKNGEKPAVLIKMNDVDCSKRPDLKNTISIRLFYDKTKPDANDDALRLISERIASKKKEIEQQVMKIYGLSNNGKVAIEFYPRI